MRIDRQAWTTCKSRATVCDYSTLEAPMRARITPWSLKRARNPSCASKTLSPSKSTNTSHSLYRLSRLQRMIWWLRTLHIQVLGTGILSAMTLPNDRGRIACRALPLTCSTTGSGTSTESGKGSGVYQKRLDQAEEYFGQLCLHCTARSMPVREFSSSFPIPICGKATKQETALLY